MLYESKLTRKFSKRPVVVKRNFNGKYMIESHNGKTIFWSHEDTPEKAIAAFERMKPYGFWYQSIFESFWD